jgi:type II secretory ATPase GspE/PulE/Tfp pilus assembly ATPase PilB-like protein
MTGNTEKIGQEQRKIYEHLVKKGKVTAQIAASQPISESRDSLIPDAIRVCKDDGAVAEAVANALGIFNLTVVEEGVTVKCAGNADNWLAYSNYLCISNPYDRALITKATDWARREELGPLKIAVISQSYLSQLRAVHGAVAEDGNVDGMDDKLALQHLDEIIRHAAQLDVSDIHFQPTQTDKVDLLYRIDGILRVQRKIDLKLHEAMVRSVMETRCNVSVHTNAQQDGKFDFQIDQNKSINLRVSTIPVVRKSEVSQKMVMRLLGNNTRLANLDRLGLAPENRELLVKFGSYPNGMIILTGPTGSGKTTTLSALLLHMHSTNPNLNYHTIEDPVELQHQGMSHTEVSVTLSFAQALRAMLRQDPDVMLVGEMRDEETAELGYKAAMTGHLVLSTLHTNNAHESIGRLERMNIDTEIIATNTTAFIAQRLCRALCKNCRQEYRLKDDPERFRIYGSHPAFSAHRGDTIVYRANPHGCNECGHHNGAGEKGRRGLIEVLEMTPEVQVAILEGVNPAILRRKQIQKGTFNDLWDDGIRLVIEGAVGFEQLEAQLKPYLYDRMEVEDSQSTHSKRRVPVVSQRNASGEAEAQLSSL